MEQEVAHGRGGCNSRCDLKVSGEMTSMVHIYIEDGCPVLRFGKLSGVLEWMDSLSGAPEWINL
jgi:hypothetical protein